MLGKALTGWKLHKWVGKGFEGLDSALRGVSMPREGREVVQMFGKVLRDLGGRGGFESVDGLGN